ADVEIGQRPGGLGAVIAVAGDVDPAHGIGFGARGHPASNERCAKMGAARKNGQPRFGTGRKGNGKPRQSRFSRARSAVLRREDLTAAIHAGLEINVVRTAQLAAVLVFDIGGRLERIRRTAEATLHRRRLPLGHCHGSNSISKSVAPGAGNAAPAARMWVIGINDWAGLYTIARPLARAYNAGGRSKTH